MVAAAQVALVGNPNAGKTSLFNRMTGLRARTANYPGITVDLRKGALKLNGRPAELLDLPGLYSLEALSPEEQVAKAVLTEGIAGEAKPDVVVLVLDATNLERNLFLASQVLDLNLPTVVALNLFDAARAADIQIEVEQLAEQLRVPVIPVSAKTGEGLAALNQQIQNYLTPAPELTILEERPSCTTGCTGCHFSARYDWAASVAGNAVRAPQTYGKYTAALDRMLTHPVVGVLAFVAVMLGVFYLIFSLAGIPMDLVDGTFASLGEFAAEQIPDQAARPWLWSAAVFGIAMVAFAGAFRLARWSFRGKGLALAILAAAAIASLPLEDFRSLIVDGVIGGVGGVVIFLPQICILFFFICLLEDSGYMARAAFVMERLMRFVGLPGKAFVPMLSAHACAIPGIMAARVIENWRDRLVTILVLPLLTCSARLPVYSMVAALLFTGSALHQALVFVCAYLLGIGAALFSAWILKKTLLKGEAVPLVIELPAYRWPGLRNALVTVVDRGGVFLRQAGSVILLISVGLWALATYPKLPADRIEQIEASMSETATESEVENAVAQESLAWSAAGRVGRAVEPIFAPLGYDWKINVGVLTSFAAREVVVSTLAIVYGVGEEAAEEESTIVETLRRQRKPDGTPVFSTATGLSLLVFFVLAMQCLPTQAVTRRETGSWKWAALQLGYMSALAWLAACLTYQVTTALGYA